MEGIIQTLPWVTRFKIQILFGLTISNMTSLYNKWKLYKVGYSNQKTPAKKAKVDAKTPDAAKDSLRQSVKPPERRKRNRNKSAIKHWQKLFSV